MPNVPIFYFSCVNCDEEEHQIILPQVATALGQYERLKGTPLSVYEYSDNYLKNASEWERARFACFHCRKHSSEELKRRETDSDRLGRLVRNKAFWSIEIVDEDTNDLAEILYTTGPELSTNQRNLDAHSLAADSLGYPNLRMEQIRNVRILPYSFHPPLL